VLRTINMYVWCTCCWSFSHNVEWSFLCVYRRRRLVTTSLVTLALSVWHVRDMHWHVRDSCRRTDYQPYRFGPDDPTANPRHPIIRLGWGEEELGGGGNGWVSRVSAAGDDGWRRVISTATAAAAAAAIERWQPIRSDDWLTVFTQPCRRHDNKY